ncbi:MAG: hypothetical protein AB7L09_13060 [Nitrospira sp.]
MQLQLAVLAVGVIVSLPTSIVIAEDHARNQTGTTSVSDVEETFRKDLANKIKESDYKSVSKVNGKIVSIDKAREELHVEMFGPARIGSIEFPEGVSSVMKFRPINALAQIPGEIRSGANVTLYFVSGRVSGYTDYRLIAIRAAKK